MPQTRSASISLVTTLATPYPNVSSREVPPQRLDRPTHDPLEIVFHLKVIVGSHDRCEADQAQPAKALYWKLKKRVCMCHEDRRCEAGYVRQSTAQIVTDILPARIDNATTPAPCTARTIPVYLLQDDRNTSSLGIVRMVRVFVYQRLSVSTRPNNTITTSEHL